MPDIKEYEVDAQDVTDFARLLKEGKDRDINYCFQCRRCTSGCPTVDLMELTPAQVIHGVRLGLKELVLNSNTYWLCVNCGACTTRCPQEVDILKVMDGLANIAIKEGIKPKEKDIATFFNTGISTIERFGVMYELGIGSMLKISSMDFSDIKMALRMLAKGKVELLPHRNNPQAVRKIMKNIDAREKGKKRE